MLETKRVQIGYSVHCTAFRALGVEWSCTGGVATFLGTEGLHREAKIQAIGCLVRVASAGGYDEVIAQYGIDSRIGPERIARLTDFLRWGETEPPEVLAFLAWARPAIIGEAIASLEGCAGPMQEEFSSSASRAFEAAFRDLGPGFFGECNDLAPAGREEEFRAWVRDLVRLCAFSGYRAAMERAAEVVEAKTGEIRAMLGGGQ